MNKKFSECSLKKNSTIKSIGVLLIDAMFIACFCIFSAFNQLYSYADTTKVQGTTKSYTPVNVALVMDASGSIASPTEENPSDPDLLSREAAKVLVNLLPTENNQVALFQYSNDCKKIADLTPLNDINNVKTLNNKLSEMKDCQGSTHMINAIQEARQYLDENAKDGVKNVIVVFTDGAENGKITPDNASEDNIKKAVNDALGDSNTVVYSVAFDYLDSTGNHSVIGDDGEGYGKKILEEFAKQSNGGVFVAEDNIFGLDEEFSNIIQDICNVREVAIDSFNGDGNTHTTKIDIGSSVLEADLRITCNTSEALKKGQIRLFNETGVEVTLSPDGNCSQGNVWFNVDKLAANIKILNPNQGQWAVEVSNVVSTEPININLIEQYNMGLKTDITFDGSSQIEDATFGDTLNVQAFLTSNNEVVTDTNIYNDKDTKAFLFISEEPKLSVDINSIDPKDVESVLSARPNTVKVNMSSTGSSFIGNIPLSEVGVCLISVWICSEKYYCYEDYVITIGDTISPSPDKDVKEIILDNGQTFTDSDIMSYCSSSSASVSLSSYDESIIEATLNNGILEVKGLTPGNTQISLQFTSASGTSNFKIDIPVTVYNNAPQVNLTSKEYTLRAGEKITDDTILSSVTDYEGDPIQLSVGNISDTNIADATVDNNILNINGIKKGETEIELLISDGTSIIPITAKVSVDVSIMSLLIVLGIILLVLIIIIVLISAMIKKQKKLRTTLNNIEIVRSDNTVLHVLDSLFMDQEFKGKSSITLYNLLVKINELCNDMNTSKIVSTYFSDSNVKSDSKLVSITGSFKKVNEDSFYSKKLENLYYEDDFGESNVTFKITNNSVNTTITLCFKMTNGEKFKLKFDYGLLEF